MCEADKGRKAAQALIRCHAVGQRIPPLSDNASGSASLISCLYIVSSIAAGVYTAAQLQTNSGQSPTKPNFVHPSPEKEAPENCPPANVCVMEKKKKEREFTWSHLDWGRRLRQLAQPEEGRRGLEITNAQKQHRHLWHGTLSEQFFPHRRSALSGRTSVSQLTERRRRLGVRRVGAQIKPRLKMASLQLKKKKKKANKLALASNTFGSVLFINSTVYLRTPHNEWGGGEVARPSIKSGGNS